MRFSIVRILPKAIHPKNATLNGAFTFQIAFQGKYDVSFPLKTS